METKRVVSSLCSSSSLWQPLSLERERPANKSEERSKQGSCLLKSPRTSDVEQSGIAGLWSDLEHLLSLFALLARLTTSE